MTDTKRRTLRLWAEAEKKLSFEQVDDEFDLGPLLGWADAMIELELIKEMENKGVNHAETDKS